MFTELLSEVRVKAAQYIYACLTDKPDGYPLVDEDTENTDAIFGCPQAAQIGEKYGSTYVDLGYVTKVFPDGTCDVYMPEGESKQIALIEMSTDEVVMIAECIYELENPTILKHWFYRLEITDGEHGYFSDGVLMAKSWESAIELAGESARLWYDSPSGKKISEDGDMPEYEHLGGTILCKVYDVRQIPEDHYNILKQYV